MTVLATAYGLFGFSVVCSVGTAVFSVLALRRAHKIVADRFADEPDMNAWPVKNEPLIPAQPRDASGRFVSRTQAMAERLRSELGRQA